MVTGAGQGIGLAICERILRDGQYAVALLESSPEGRNAAERLRTEGGDVLHVQCDVSSESDVVSAMEAVTEFGSVRCVINNAGIFPRMSALQMDFEDWMKVVRVNRGGTFLVSRTFAPEMLRSGGGAIVNITSGRAVRGAINGSHYSASKGGLISLTRSLALEWAPAIRVNAVMPGVTDTAQPRAEGITDEELYARGSTIPLGRIGQPDDIAEAVMFLLGAGARYITGQTIAVNGGAVMR